MSHALSLSNGSLFVGINARGCVNDFYWPHVGQENHVGVDQNGYDHIHLVGVYAEGALHWLTDEGWEVEVGAKSDTYAGRTIARNEALAVELEIEDVVYNEKPIFLRRFRLRNVGSEEREFKLFCAHQFEISESYRGDTAYFNPELNTIVHYKGKRVFMVGAGEPGESFDDYSVGVFGIEGKDGTHRDAEDGALEKNPIEHGHTDSVIGFTRTLKAGEVSVIDYWLTCGETFPAVCSLNEYVLSKGADHLHQSTIDFWHAWLTKYDFQFYDLSSGAAELFKRSLCYVRAHADQDGALIASADASLLNQYKDTYSYSWPRDAAYGALALDRVGEVSATRRWFEFCNRTITSKGYFLHKYRPDGSFGSSWHPWVRDGVPSLPIQEDETAIVLVALWNHYRYNRDLEFVESVYNSLIKRAADFLVAYRSEDGLPQASYDLWEERFGVHSYTAGVVYGGLRAAEAFARTLGKGDDALRYEKAALEVQAATLEQFYDEERGLWRQSLPMNDSEASTTVDASSLYGLVAFGLLPAKDPRALQALENSRRILSPEGSIGGVMRYERDAYYQAFPEMGGNVWFITTLWYAQLRAWQATSPEDLGVVRETLEWVAKYQASKAGILSEQLNPKTGESVSVAPLAWSHAEYIRTVVVYLDKLSEFGLCSTCNPVQ